MLASELAVLYQICQIKGLINVPINNCFSHHSNNAQIWQLLGSVANTVLEGFLFSFWCLTVCGETEMHYKVRARWKYSPSDQRCNLIVMGEKMD